MSTPRRLDDIPALEPEVRAALTDFKRMVVDGLGERVAGFYLFGSRARGTHRPDSDVDVMVFLEQETVRIGNTPPVIWNAKGEMIGRYELDFQVWPMPVSALRNPETSRAPAICRAVAREGVSF